MSEDDGGEQNTVEEETANTSESNEEEIRTNSQVSKLSQPKVISSAANHALTTKIMSNNHSLDSLQSFGNASSNITHGEVSWSSRSWPLDEPHPFSVETKNLNTLNDLKHVLHGVWYEETNDSISSSQNAQSRVTRSIPRTLRRIEPSINIHQQGENCSLPMTNEHQLSVIQTTNQTVNASTSTNDASFSGYSLEVPVHRWRLFDVITGIFQHFKTNTQNIVAAANVTEVAEVQVVIPSSSQMVGGDQISMISAPSSLGAPPTYSDIIRRGPSANLPPYTNQRQQQQIALQSSSFYFQRTPPPSYGEVQGLYTGGPFVNSVDEMSFGPDPMTMICPRCATVVVTNTYSQRSALTHLSAAAMCLCGCWPCCLLPYCMDTCKNTYHYCPSCHNILGMYRPY